MEALEAALEDGAAVARRHVAGQAAEGGPVRGWSLDLSYSKLVQVPSSATVLQDARLARTLDHMNLSDNRLERVPGALLRRLSALRVLVLRYNLLTTLPTDVGRLTLSLNARRSRLEYLRLENNRLEHLPDAIGHLPQLKVLQLGSNQLRELPASLGQLTQLEALYVYNNQLRQLPASVQRLTQLALLYAGNNRLDGVPNLAPLQRLAELDLSNNRLHSVPSSLGACTNLRILYLAFNCIDHVPSQLGQLHLLHTLDVRHNRLAVLPAEITRLRHLHTIHFLDNPLQWTEGPATPVQRWPPSLVELAARQLLQRKLPLPNVLPRELLHGLRAARTHACYVCGEPFWRELTVVLRIAQLPSSVPVVYRLCRPSHVSAVPELQKG